MCNHARPRRSYPSVSIVVPVYNEETAISLFLEAVISVLEADSKNWEIIFVNDGSSDQTLSVIRNHSIEDPRIKGVDLSRNFGKEIALTTGLDFASNQVVIPMDVDLQDPPQLIPEMIDRWRDGYEVVLAKRSDRKSDSFAKRLSASMFYCTMSRLTKIDIPANVGDFRLLGSDAMATLRKYPERERFMKGLFASLGFKTATIEYVRPERSTGETKFNPWKLWSLALEGIISFSSTPLKIWTYIGITCATASALYLLTILIKTIILGIDMPGYASLMCVVLFMNGLILTGLGVIAEYIARIFNEVKNRPLYVVQECIGKFDPDALVQCASAYTEGQRWRPSL
ncbi:glycosyltransferase [Erythrobacter litoralis]|uniref:glycosyltransferase family 2 protein n=1 Tax=Erythrobacter litoralis TaxID=39960 RepID=UPI0024351D17|nr:glycosyltransferase family 2 protein [Erythrobacter litoralis]MDG6078177.1 glycosyltransferase [Erythrobacter litoralis]